MTGVSDVGVSLIGKSATAIITRKELVEELKEAIENAGYEPEIMGIEPVQSDIDESDQAGPRTVTLRVEGMFCSHCPEKVMSLLDPLLPRITILTPITSYTEPKLRLSYLPSLPDFTIRTIIDAISTPNASHPFTATIHHPPTLEERARHMHRREQHALLRRLLFSFIAAIPTFIIGIVYMSLVPSSNNVRIWLMRPLWTGNASRVQWALFFLATPVMFYSAGVSVAYFSSIALLALAASQEASPSGEGDATTYFDSVVLLTMFLLAGRFLEAYSKGRTADAITALGRLRPTTALLVNQSYFAGNLSSPNLAVTNSDDPEKGVPSESHSDVVLTPESALLRISAELLEIGDVVRVQHGASPPADGILANIIGDQALFDESSLTGESRPIRKGVGERVYVGTINRGAVVDVRVDATGGETMLDHIVKVVREGQTRRAPIERLADMITGYFVPVVTLLAIITWIVWLALGLSGTLPSDYLDIPVGGWPVWSLEFAIAVFVVACPCGIGLAAPTALLVGSGLAARYGILVRGGGEAFQEAAQLDLVVFDKTGTLSEGGDPRVTDAVTFPSLVVPRKDEVLFGIAAELESISTHPLAGAIRSYCVANGAASRVGPAIAFQETAGRGVKANFKEQEGIIGNEAWMAEHEAVIDGKMEARLNAWKSEGKSVALLALREGDGTAFEIRAIFAVADPLRSEASAVVSSLQDQGIGTWMISGDNAVTARAVARIVGIPETNVIAGVLPHEKAQKVQWLQQVGMKRLPRGWRRWIGTRNLNSRCIVAMVGDGINDAPALTAADVGIAIGSGSDVAISSASFILVSSNLTGLLTLIDLSRTVFNRVKFNFLWASIYNIIALPIAAGVIYPAAHHPRLAPVWASLAMALSSVSVYLLGNAEA
ncbi:hypothetical protein EW026_g169 [Hermanssonia centrifuga]|uniref:P-type ATPase A domain-containing protein n=1 Tax=Hermanssonia centrifuga TaxID=98765 RepID=A0A4S4L039_9APHY|nr:hypothetical protein EW026_g169 [Hermanssonia centrifuga]